MIEFTIAGEAVPKGRPQFRVIRMGGKAIGQAYTPAETRAAERALVLSARPFRPRKPLEGPIHVTTVFVISPPMRFPPDRSHEWPHVKPDDDNLRKLVLDALNGTFWHDDSQICGGESFKIYGAEPRTFVRIRQLGRDDHAHVMAMLGEPVPQLGMFGSED